MDNQSNNLNDVEESPKQKDDIFNAQTEVSEPPDKEEESTEGKMKNLDGKSKQDDNVSEKHK